MFSKFSFFINRKKFVEQKPKKYKIPIVIFLKNLKIKFEYRGKLRLNLYLHIRDRENV
jgi:hypothetical protein